MLGQPTTSLAGSIWAVDRHVFSVGTCVNAAQFMVLDPHAPVEPCRSWHIVILLGALGALTLNDWRSLFLDRSKYTFNGSSMVARLAPRSEGLPKRVGPKLGEIGGGRSGGTGITPGLVSLAWLMKAMGLANRSEELGWPGLSMKVRG